MKILQALCCWVFLSSGVSAWAETIKMAAEDDWAPYSYQQDGSANPVGFSVDIVRAAFQTQGVEVEFVTVPFARCLHYSATGLTVGCFNVSINDKTRNQFYWHSTPLFCEEVGVFAHISSQNSDVNVQGLEGKSVGYTSSYTYSSYVTQNPYINFFTAKSDRQLLQLVAADRVGVDYVLISAVPTRYLLATEPELYGKVKQVGSLMSDPMHIAFSKTHPDGQRMSALFERGLQALHRTGQYNSLLPLDMTQAQRCNCLASTLEGQQPARQNGECSPPSSPVLMGRGQSPY